LNSDTEDSQTGGLFEPSEDYLALESFVLEQKPGARLSWHHIQHVTGVEMDYAARCKLRRALEKHRIEWNPLKGYGIEIANANTATKVVGRRLVKVSNAISRTLTSGTNLIDRHGEEMHPGDRENIEHSNAVCGAMLTYSSGAQKALGPAADSRDKKVASDTKAEIVKPKGKWC